MKSIKRIITTIAVLLITTSFFAQIAQTSDYEIHLQKGKEYENQKKWIYALGEYYDALDSIFADIKNEDIYKLVELNQIPDFQEALESYKNLAEKIENGNPGYGEFDDFTLLDNWILLLKEFEKYWTENSPQRVYFGKPERTALNRENRTATYKIFITSENTPKYQEILKIVETGLRETNPSEWNEKLTWWPKISVYDNNVQKLEDNMIPDGIPLIRRRAEITPLPYGKTYYELRSKSAAAINGDIFIIKFNVVDANGNVLLKSKQYYLRYEDKYIFKDVPQQTMNLIDSDKVNIILDSAYLKYGTMDEELINYKEENLLERDQAILKNLSEIKLDTNKIPCITWQNVDFEIAPYRNFDSYRGYLLPKIENYLYLKGIN